jgi:hypothetical protein
MVEVETRRKEASLNPGAENLVNVEEKQNRGQL